MNFSEFLKSRSKLKKHTRVQDHYEELGGKEKLGFSLRQFHYIENGDSPPNERILAVLFKKCAAAERRELVIAFFTSLYAGKKGQIGKDLVNYVNLHLAPPVETKTRSIWEERKKLKLYSDEQLDFFNENPAALRFHKKLLLLESVDTDEITLDPETVKRMKALCLIVEKKGLYLPSDDLYRLPAFENSNPQSVAKASDLILNHINLYISKEGSENQELSYTTMLVPNEMADRILNQLKLFKQWVQSLATQDSSEHSTPFIFVGFAKKIQKREL